MYSENSQDILSRMLGNVPNDLYKSEGSFLFDSLSPVSEELAQSKIQLDEVLNRVFAISASENGYSEELETRCGEFGIYRKDGTEAIGQVTFSGTNNIVISLDTIVQTKGGLQYKTTVEKTITGGTATVTVEAIGIGNKYNIPSNVIIELPVQIPGITDVINNNAIIGGTEKESDTDLLNRLLLKVRTPATSGNVNHYKQWATEIAGIGDAKVFPVWNGPGTVKVCVIDSNKQPASDILVNQVRTNIESNRPIGATVSVISAAPLQINISANFTIKEGFSNEQIINGIKDKVTKYLESIAFTRDYVSYAYVGSILFDVEGVMDYTNFKINNDSRNISIGPENITITGEVVIDAT